MLRKADANAIRENMDPIQDPIIINDSENLKNARRKQHAAWMGNAVIITNIFAVSEVFDEREWT